MQMSDHKYLTNIAKDLKIASKCISYVQVFITNPISKHTSMMESWKRCGK